MKIAILGIDGYIGYPLALHLLNKDYEICGLDNNIRRHRVSSLSSKSLTPISTISERNDYLISHKNFSDQIANIKMTDYSSLSSFLKWHKPDTIIHLAEQPSAPWSMKNATCAHITQHENVIGTLNLLWAIKEYCPDAHLVKLGTMGEYGTPDCGIPEGVIPEKCLDSKNSHYYNPGNKCPMSGLLFPRSPNSFYHLSKVHDTYNIKFACNTWGLRSTDIMQGVVFGLMETEPEKITRFDYDEYFGTVINRFCAQAIINHPLTVYGRGNQIRGFLPLKDSIQCLTLVIEHPPYEGEYRTLNQFENIYSIGNLANMVWKGAASINIETLVGSLPNPRTESDQHYYNPEHQKLFTMGYRPTTDIQDEIDKLISQLLPYKDNVLKDVILPKTKWRR